MTVRMLHFVSRFCHAAPFNPRSVHSLIAWVRTGGVVRMR